MAYNEKILHRATEILTMRKSDAENEAEMRHAKLVKECPEVLTLEDVMRKSAFEIVKSIGMGDNAENYIKKLQKNNREAKSEIQRVLSAMGLPSDYLEPHYTCSICKDTGFAEGKLCKCHLDLLKQLSYENLCKSSPLKLSSFDDFDLSYYNDTQDHYDTMKRNFEFCKNYAENFDMSSKSIIMRGETGLGKTHLSLAIAGKVLSKGYGVVYGSVQNFFSSIEKEHFGRGDAPDGTTEKILLDCDLLILDDLGAEFTTQFTIATLNNIINTRLLTAKPTIISTNLRIEEIADKYSRRITSRIIGEYIILIFGGKDVRQQKFVKS